MTELIRRLLRKLSSPPEPLVVRVASDAIAEHERQTVRDWLRHPTTLRVLALMESKHPGTVTAQLTKVARSEWDQLAAVNFLNRIAGWESYRNALLNLANAPAQSKDLAETYPTQ